jgi:hypothetical protein
MDLKIGSSYIIVFKIGEKPLTFHCKIISVDSDGFIEFEDKFGKKLCYNKNTIMSTEELDE